MNRPVADKSRNYLQSPYFFMVVNLQDADLNRPGQLAAAHQGEALDAATQSALAGTLVSSLHRLKDIDNTGMFRRRSAHVNSCSLLTRRRFLRFPRPLRQDRG